MTAPADDPWLTTVDVGAPELDLLVTYAGEPAPFPLRARSFGRIDGERGQFLAAAGDALAERGLADAHGPIGLAADLVTALREHDSTIDLVVVRGSTVTGVVAMLHEHHAVVCHQRIDGEPGPVTVTKITDGPLTTEFARHVPVVAAAATMPITLPPGVVDDATRLLENTAGLAAPQRRVRELVAARGGDPAAVAALLDVLPSVTGRGQLGVTRRTAGGVRRPFELSWLDGTRGRLRVDTDDHGWVSVNPLRHNELVLALRDAAATAHG